MAVDYLTLWAIMLTDLIFCVITFKGLVKQLQSTSRVNYSTDQTEMSKRLSPWNLTAFIIISEFAVVGFELAKLSDM